MSSTSRGKVALVAGASQGDDRRERRSWFSRLCTVADRLLFTKPGVVSQETLERCGRVLVVDDDDAIRVMVERILRREKFEVDSARDGFEAIEKLSQNDYGTILLDLMMPRVDGHGVLRYLITDRSSSQPAVIIMTANLQSAVDTVDALPVRCVLPKPFDIRTMIDHVRECCGAR